MDITEADDYARTVLIDFMDDRAFEHIYDTLREAIDQDIDGTDEDRATFHDAVSTILMMRIRHVVKQLRNDG